MGTVKDIAYFDEKLNSNNRSENFWLEIEKDWDAFRRNPETKEAALKYEKDNWVTFESLHMICSGIRFEKEKAL